MLQRINIGLLSKDQIIQNIIEKNRNNYTEFYLDYLKSIRHLKINCIYEIINEYLF